MFHFRFFLVFISIALSGCGLIGPKVEFYDDSAVAKESNVATITGTKTEGQHSFTSVLLFVQYVDNQLTNRSKKARCSFDKPIPLQPGNRELRVVVSAGEPFAYSRYGLASLVINAIPDAKLTLKSEIHSNFSATVWVEDMQGNLTSEKISVVLEDNPRKGMPLGYALIDNNCALP